VRAFGLSKVANIMGIFFKAHVLEKYVCFIIKTLRVLNWRLFYISVGAIHESPAIVTNKKDRNELRSLK
jgi:hypothetical protein